MEEDTLQGRSDVAGQQAVNGEAAAGDCGEGIAGCGKDPVQGVRNGHVDGPKEGHVLQPQIHCLHLTHNTPVSSANFHACKENLHRTKSLSQSILQYSQAVTGQGNCCEVAGVNYVA